MKDNKKNIHFRKKYIDPSRKFLEWVDNFRFEQTLMGHYLHRLDRRFGLRDIFLLWLFCFILSMVLFYHIEFKESLKAGSIAQNDVKSPIDFQVVDAEATKVKREEAQKSLPPIFDYDSKAYEEILPKIDNAFNSMRLELGAEGWSPKKPYRATKFYKESKYKKKFEQDLGIDITNSAYHWLLNKGFGDTLQKLITKTLNTWSQQMIFDGGGHSIEKEDQVIIRNIQESLQQESLQKDGTPSELTVSNSKIFDLRRKSHFTSPFIESVEDLNEGDRSQLIQLAHQLIVPNTFLNRKGTALRQTEISKSVLPIQISVQKNQIIVKEGAVVQPIHVQIINEIKRMESRQRTGWLYGASSLLFVVCVLVFFSYLRRFTLNKVRVELKDIVAMGTVTLMMVVFIKIFLFLTDSAFRSQLGSVLPSSVFLYMAPLAAGPMMIGLLISTGEVVWLFTVFIATVIAVMVDMNFAIFVLSMIGGMAGARGVYGCKRRNDIYWAGVRTGMVSALTMLTILVLMDHLGDLQNLKDFMWIVPAAFVGGVASSMLAMVCVPLLESLFNYTTDIKLLELSNLDHVLMKEMMVKAPGTYHHALAVGTMVDEAAQKIEANPLLAKVMAYYHDIGKVEHAQYFVENQRPGYNPHDYISPYMSKTILIAHVKDGAEIGLRHKLGRPIIDGILQHHGTTLASYFYNKALGDQGKDSRHIKENDFRYPGPKPQFKEAGLVMLADSVEAAARSIDEPTAHRLTTLVTNIIQSKFIDGQLEECNLTFKDLSIIEETLKRPS